jgi:hypothetical protein
MIPVPWSLEPELPPEDFQKIGQLAIRWSHIDQIIGNCLKSVLRLSDDEATVMVFPLSAETRINRLCELSAVAPFNEKAEQILGELRPVLKGLQLVRNNVIHAFVRDDLKDGVTFHLRSKDRVLTREQVFSSEALTNYAGHLALALRFALGLDGSTRTYNLPERPEIPEFLRSIIHFPKE